jgi:hypothetical protein
MPKQFAHTITTEDPVTVSKTLVWIGGFLGIVTITLTIIALLQGNLQISGPIQAIAASKQTSGSVDAYGARDAAPLLNDLFTGMPLP